MSSDTTLPYAARRDRLAARLGAGGIAIVPTAPERQRNRDSDFPFRHDSYFYYLTGFTEPHAWLVLDGSGRTTLFCAPKDLEREMREAATNLEFERAARLRDEVKRLREMELDVLEGSAD